MTRPLARSLGRVIQLPPPARGQFGPNHTVVEVLKPDAWIDQDPFILFWLSLMTALVSHRLRPVAELNHRVCGFDAGGQEPRQEHEGAFGRLQNGW